MKNKISIREIRDNYLNVCLEKCETRAKRRIKTKRRTRYHELIKNMINQSKKDKNKNNRTSISVTNDFKVLVGSRRSLIQNKLNLNIIEQINYYKNKENEYLSDDQKEIIYITENKLPKGHFTEKFIGPTDEEGVYKKHLDITHHNLKKKVINRNFRNHKRQYLLSPIHNNNSNSTFYKSTFPVLNKCVSFRDDYKNNNTSLYQHYSNLIQKKKIYSFNYSNNSKTKSKSKSKINIKLLENNFNCKYDGKKIFFGHQSEKNFQFKNFFFSKSDMFY